MHRPRPVTRAARVDQVDQRGARELLEQGGRIAVAVDERHVGRYPSAQRREAGEARGIIAAPGIAQTDHPPV